jgi:hypothetical protein
MNALDQDLKPSTALVLTKDYDPALSEDERLFFCDCGFGMAAGTQGRTIGGHFKDGYEAQIDGVKDIDVTATRTYWEKQAEARKPRAFGQIAVHFTVNTSAAQFVQAVSQAFTGAGSVPVGTSTGGASASGPIFSPQTP